MHYSITTPPRSRPAERPAPIDDALIAETRAALSAALTSVPFTGSLSRRESEALFRVHLSGVCQSCRTQQIPIEKLLVAVKLAWTTLAVDRLRLGDTAPDVLAGAVSACIASYFQDEERRRAD